jgi:lysophospholipase L1-like esterase
VAALGLVVLLGGLYVTAKGARRVYRWYVEREGLRQNREAWEAGFRERHLPVPESGPRDGYWGSRLGPHTVDPVLGWVLPELHVPRLLDLDASGMQHVGRAGGVSARVLVLGASTAFGGYASAIDRTYFSVMADALAGRGRPVRVSVDAVGAWKSVQEITSLERRSHRLDPDVVVFLNGLNDVTNGSNARTLYGEQTRTLDGSTWHPLYHEHDYPARVERYLENMREVRDWLRARRVVTVFALQPALFEKRQLSPIEDRLLGNILAFLGPREVLQQSYADIRAGLTRLADGETAFFVDCSRVYDAEEMTVFTDVWHFSDPGHRILGEALAAALEPILDKLAAAVDWPSRQEAS